MAIKKACLVKNSVKNTGKECDTSMVATAMLIAVPNSLVITEADLEDPIAWITPLLHADAGVRIFPLFGQQAPIRTITNSQEGDVLVTLDDGLQVFLRYGIYNRTFETTSGGLCYAASLQSLNKSGYRIIEVDQQGQMLLRKNSDGTFSGMITDFMYAPSPILADFKTTPYKNRFQISFSPVELVNNGVIFEGASELLSLMGLIDSELVYPTDPVVAPTTTQITFAVRTECAEADLVALLGASLGTHVNNFRVFNEDGTVNTPTAAAIVAGNVRLTGTFASGTDITIKGGKASAWLANGAEGYDAENSTIVVPIP